MKGFFDRLVKISVVFAALVTFCSNGFSEEEYKQKISEGDKVTIKVAEQQGLNGVYDVEADGKIEFPLIPERIEATGLTYSELAGKIKEKLEEKYFYHATVSVLPPVSGFVPHTSASSKGGTVYVSGLVARQGALKLPAGEEMTVSKVIIRSGGFLEFANKKNVKLIRRSPVTGKVETKELNMVDIIEKGKLDEDVEVRDGDTIVVPEQFFNF
ncbi:MAG: polysaccharide biosynthesis/export family protein [Candidatus Omnitrophota bacterium]